MAAKATKAKKSTQRKLTAILSADVHGYSRLMGAELRGYPRLMGDDHEGNNGEYLHY